MKLKELIKELTEKLEEVKGKDLEVSFTYSVKPNCDCTRHGGYCYCSYEEVQESISCVSLTRDTKEIILS